MVDRDVYERFVKECDGDWSCFDCIGLGCNCGELRDLDEKGIIEYFDDDSYDWDRDYGVDVVVVEDWGIEKEEVLKYGRDFSEDVREYLDGECKVK